MPFLRVSYAPMAAMCCGTPISAASKQIVQRCMIRAARKLDLDSYSPVGGLLQPDLTAAVLEGARPNRRQQPADSARLARHQTDPDRGLRACRAPPEPPDLPRSPERTSAPTRSHAAARGQSDGAAVPRPPTWAARMLASSSRAGSLRITALCKLAQVRTSRPPMRFCAASPE